MRKLVNSFMLCSAALLVCSYQQVSAAVNFSDRSASFVLSGGKLHVGSPTGFVVGGTVEFNSTTPGLSGTSLVMSDGSIIKDGWRSSTLSGTYFLDGSDTVHLNNGFLAADPGTVYSNIVVSGTSRLYGSPLLFGGNIVLADSSTLLAIGCQEKLSATISLNGGTIALADDLRLDDNSQIYGPGTVIPQNFRIYLGDSAPQTWATDLTFGEGPDFELLSDITVQGAWTIPGDASLNGNGHVLDLSAGTFHLINAVKNSRLTLSNVTVKGLSNSTGLILGSAQCNVELDGAQLEFSGDTDFTQGMVTVSGESTLVLTGKKVSFKTGSVLTVNDRLELDDRTQIGVQAAAPGTLSAPQQIYSNGVVSSSGILAGIAAGTIVLGSRGLIEVGDGAGMSAAQQALTSGSLTDNQTITFDQTPIVITHDRPAIINAKGVVIDGQGGTLGFAGASGALSGLGTSAGGTLFRVGAKASVTLQNITLDNVTQDTFDIAGGGSVSFGENVTLQLGGDVFLTSGTLSIADVAGGNMLTVRGINGSKKFVLIPSDKTQTIMLQLGSSSLALQQVELIGVRFVAATSSSASIALAGGATVDVEASTALNFDVEDGGNEIALTQDGLTLSGAIAWTGSAAENVLSIRFAIPTAIAAKTVVETDAAGNSVTVPVRSGNPLVIFDGDPGVFLTSSTVAGLIFPDKSVSIMNGVGGNTNAFVIDQNSYMTTNNIEILGHAIKQSSARSNIVTGVVTGRGIDASFIRAHRPDAARAPRKLSSFARIREAQRQHVAAMPAAKVARPEPVKPQPGVKSKRQQKRSGDLDLRGEFEAFMTGHTDELRGMDSFDAGMLRTAAPVKNAARDAKVGYERFMREKVASFDKGQVDWTGIQNAHYDPMANVPATYQRRVDGGSESSGLVVSGSVDYVNGGANLAFVTDPNTAYTIGLGRNAELHAVAGAALTLGADQFLNVTDTGAKIVLRGGRLHIDPTHLNLIANAQGRADLTIAAVADDNYERARVTIDATRLALLGNVSLRFEGPIDLHMTNSPEVLFLGSKKAGVVTHRPSLTLVDGVVLNVPVPLSGDQTYSVALFDGIGSFTLDNASIMLNTVGIALFGFNEHDDMQINFQNNAKVVLTNPAMVGPTGDKASLDFAFGQFDVSIRDSQFYVNYGGVVNWGSVATEYDANLFRNFELSNAAFFLASGGFMRFAENMYDPATFVTPNTNFIINQFTLSGMGGGLGSGQFQYIKSADVNDAQSYLKNIAATSTPSFGAKAVVAQTIGQFLAPLVS